MAELIREKGLEGATIREVADRAGTSPTAFRTHFHVKEACLIEVCDLAGERLAATVTAAYDRVGSWPEQVRAGLAAFLDSAAGNPELTRTLMLEVPRMGAAGQRSYRRAFGLFLPLLEPGRRYCESAEALPPNVGLLALAGAEAIVVNEVASGRVHHLDQVAPEILFALLVPYLGPKAVAAEIRQLPAPL